MVLPTQNFGLEQFLEMTKALKWVEDKYKNPQPHNSQQRQLGSTTTGANQKDQNQATDEMTNSTSHPSQITKSTQIGNISVEQIAMALETNHLIEALEEVYPAPYQEDLECQVVESQWLTAQYDPDNYYIDLESGSSFSKY